MGKRMVILGAAESGVGAAVLAQKKGFDVFVSDMGKIKPHYVDMLDRYGIAWEDGGHTEELVLNADEVIKSPGIPEDAPMVLKVKAAGIPIISEIEFAGRYTHAKMICITGSNGKTTTKELVSRVLARRFRVYATRGNLNNHIGVPLTLLAMTGETQFGIVEMGASACGEIALLCSIAEPNYGIVTNIGRAHLEGFGGPEGVRRGKGELYDWLARTGGRVFVPANDPVLMSMAAERETLAAECYPTTLADGVEHHLEGDYNRFNVAAAVAVGRYFGVDDERIRYAVGSYRPDNHRSQKIRTGQNTLILDCYNANPSSMQASLVNFRQEPLEGCTRKILILGDMLELGDWSDAEHRHIISLAAEIPDARILLVGPHFAKAYRSLESRPADTTLYPSQEVLAAELRKHPVSQALILVKGSHSIGLERLADLL